MNPAIVINAYNRPHSLARLLLFLERASYPEGTEIPLVISIEDASHQPEVAAIAQQFPWSLGPKKIISREQRLGLLDHFYACGDLTENLGQIIYLEDDLLVSPVFYYYAAQALNYYQSDPRIAGISLYNLWFNGYTHTPFTPYLDETDVFFIQLPYTQGIAFTRDQWLRFRSWEEDQSIQEPNRYPLHEVWSLFSPDEWFPKWTRFTVSTGRFFVYPRASLTTGTGEKGTHFTRSSNYFQVPLLQEKTSFQFKSIDDSLAVYDSFFEVLPNRLNRQTDLLNGYDYTVDLNATRTMANISTEFLITTRQCRRPIHTFGKSLKPIEANITSGIPGEGIIFCKKEDLLWGIRADLLSWTSNQIYYSRGNLPGFRRWLKLKIGKASLYVSSKL